MTYTISHCSLQVLPIYLTGHSLDSPSSILDMEAKKKAELHRSCSNIQVGYGKPRDRALGLDPSQHLIFLFLVDT